MQAEGDEYMKTVLVDKNGTVSVAEIPKPKYGPKQALT